MSHKQVLIIRKDLNMRKGKIASQASHASMAAILNNCSFENGTMTMHLDVRSESWIRGSFKKICVYVTSEQELRDLYAAAREANMLCSLIIDCGATEFNGVPTATAVAIGPDFDAVVDKITKHLPLF